MFRFTNISCNIGGNSGTKVFTVKHDDMLTLMSRLKLTLKEGRLPEPGTREIAIHYFLAKNKKLGVGDKIGSNIDKDEIIEGERTIVGLIDGKSIVSFDSLETWLIFVTKPQITCCILFVSFIVQVQEDYLHHPHLVPPVQE